MAEDDPHELFADVPRGARVIYIQKDGSGTKQLNALVLGCAATLAIAMLGLGAWGLSVLVSTREEVAGLRVEMRTMNERMGRIEQQGRP